MAMGFRPGLSPPHCCFAPAVRRHSMLDPGLGSFDLYCYRVPIGCYLDFVGFALVHIRHLVFVRSLGIAIPYPVPEYIVEPALPDYFR